MRAAVTCRTLASVLAGDVAANFVGFVTSTRIKASVNAWNIGLLDLVFSHAYRPMKLAIGDVFEFGSAATAFQ